MAARPTPTTGAIEREIVDALRAAGASLVGFDDLSPFPAEATHGMRSAI